MQNSLTFPWPWKRKGFSLTLPWPWQPWSCLIGDQHSNMTYIWASRASYSCWSITTLGKNEWMNERTNEQTNKQTNKFILRAQKSTANSATTETNTKRQGAKINVVLFSGRVLFREREVYTFRSLWYYWKVTYRCTWFSTDFQDFTQRTFVTWNGNKLTKESRPYLHALQSLLTSNQIAKF